MALIKQVPQDLQFSQPLKRDFTLSPSKQQPLLLPPILAPQKSKQEIEEEFKQQLLAMQNEAEEAADDMEFSLGEVS